MSRPGITLRTFVFLDRGKRISVESAASVEQRAKRLVRIAFASAQGLPELAARLRSARATARDSVLVAELSGDDPRDFLAELAALRELPPPSSIEYGRTSLQDLYRDLYGVEAC